MLKIYLLTRYQPRNYPRYLISFQPMLTILAAISLRRLSRSGALRAAYLAAPLALTAASNFRTIDPVSLPYYPAFQLGDRKLLALGGNFDSDSLVYNLELMVLHRIQNRILQDIRPDDRTELFATVGASFFNPGWIDRESFERSGRWDGGEIAREGEPGA